MSNTPKIHNNGKVRRFLVGYYAASELCADYPQIDDIFSGVLELKTAGDTSTRSLSRQVLFHILQWCPTIDVASIKDATNGNYAYSTLAAYAAVARVASKAIEGFIDKLPDTVSRTSVKYARQAIDAPYEDELAEAVAASRPWSPDPIFLTYRKGSGRDGSKASTTNRDLALADLLESTP